MAQGTSFPARGEPLERIKLALGRWRSGTTDDVRWKESEVKWVRSNLDATQFSVKTITGLVHDHIVRDGNAPRCQADQTGQNDEDYFYYVVLNIGQPRELFVKWVLRPDNPDNPCVYFCSVHWQTNA